VRVDVVVVVRESHVASATQDVSPCASIRLLAYQD